MSYQSSDFHNLSNGFLCYDTIYKSFHFLAIDSAYRVEVATMSIDALSKDLCFSFEQEWIFTSYCGKWNFFFLDIQSRFYLSSWCKTTFITLVSYRSTDFNHLVHSFFGYLAIKDCFCCFSIFSKDRDVMSSFTFDSCCNNVFLTSWDVRIFFLDNFKWNFFSSCDEFWSGFNIGSHFIFIKTS